MKFFNLDLHIGVIGDIKKILTDLGHSVTDWTLSGHSWATGRERDPVDVINHANWRQIDEQMCDAFYERYRDELSTYDAFIVTHTPCFAALYRRWNKPILVVASTRYEHPFTPDPKKWENLNEYLRDGIDKHLVIPLANNKYDAAYAEHFTDRQWAVIPSICAYTGMRYNPSENSFLYWSKFNLGMNVKHLRTKESLLPGRFRLLLNRLPFVPKKHGFDWAEIARHKGIVHIPYNVSVMSIFEQYTANIPLFFPTQRLLLELMNQSPTRPGALSEISFNQVFGLPAGSRINAGANDPNDFTNRETMSRWVALSDFYDPENMPFIQFFDSLEEIENLLGNADLAQISMNMKGHNQKRKEWIYGAWEEVISRIERMGLS